MTILVICHSVLECWSRTRTWISHWDGRDFIVKCFFPPCLKAAIKKSWNILTQTCIFFFNYSEMPLIVVYHMESLLLQCIDVDVFLSSLQLCGLLLFFIHLTTIKKVWTPAWFLRAAIFTTEIFKYQTDCKSIIINLVIHYAYSYTLYAFSSTNSSETSWLS